MSDAPQYRGTPRMTYPFKYALVYARSEDDPGDEEGTVQAFFVDKTIADKCCNELNATIGQGKVLWRVCKIFPRDKG